MWKWYLSKIHIWKSKLLLAYIQEIELCVVSNNHEQAGVRCHNCDWWCLLYEWLQYLQAFWLRFHQNWLGPSKGVSSWPSKPQFLEWYPRPRELCQSLVEFLVREGRKARLTRLYRLGCINVLFWHYRSLMKTVYGFHLPLLASPAEQLKSREVHEIFRYLILKE